MENMLENYGLKDENEENENFFEISTLSTNYLDNLDFKIINEPEKIDYENIVLELKNGKDIIFSKCLKSMEADSEEMKKFLYESKEFYLNKCLFKKFLLKNKKLKNIYLLNKNWYEKWKKYINYDKIKRSSLNAEIYKKKSKNKIFN